MQDHLRPSGIPTVGDVPWGAHFCQFYGERDDLADSLVPFFKAGLEANEQCLWVTSDPFGAEDARVMLRNAVPDLDDRIHQGQIEIIDHRDWYMRSAERTASEVLQGWVERHDGALSHGYAGLRLTGNTYWLERKDWSGFVDYESRVSKTFEGHHIIGLCSYCTGKCQATDVLDVVRNHQFALIREQGDWQLIESAALKVAKAELLQLNLELESRVAQRTAQLENALRVRDQFLSVASHELKTPITSLQLYVDGLLRAFQREPLTREDAEMRLQKAKSQCGRLEKLINHLLDVSRASSGALPMDLEEVDLAELARTVSERCAEPLRAAGCTVSIQAPEPVMGFWDPTRLDQVLTNLLMNAARHAAGSTVQVIVSTGAGTARLLVGDDGPGISPKDHHRIFERFVRVDPQTHTGGFGLGLWIVRQIVEAHGGRVELHSAPGAGATFHLDLPRQLPS